MFMETHTEFLHRTLQGSQEVDKYIVKLHGTVITPLHAKDAEQRLILVLERRGQTLAEALSRGLTRNDRKLIAFDVARALSFLHNEDIVSENLTSDSVSVSDSNCPFR